MNLAFSVSASSSTVNSPIASKSPGILNVEQIGQVQGNLTQEIAITTRRRVLKGGKKDLSTGKLVATEEDKEHLNNPDDAVSTGKLVAPGYPGIQEFQETQETRKLKATTKIGQTIFIFPQIMCRTWRRFSRS